MNLREAWAKRRGKRTFISKLTDCDGENPRPTTSLNFTRDCGYISADGTQGADRSQSQKSAVCLAAMIDESRPSSCSLEAVSLATARLT